MTGHDSRTDNWCYLGFNITQPPFDDPNVRQALALALEIDKEIEVTLKGLDQRAVGFVPPRMLGHNEALEPSAFDPDAARRLLRESSYGGAENLPPIKSYSSDDAIHWAWREHLGLAIWGPAGATGTISCRDPLSLTRKHR